MRPALPNKSEAALWQRVRVLRRCRRNFVGARLRVQNGRAVDERPGPPQRIVSAGARGARVDSELQTSVAFRGGARVEVTVERPRRRRRRTGGISAAAAASIFGRRAGGAAAARVRGPPRT
jgi:hypothetical protein